MAQKWLQTLSFGIEQKPLKWFDPLSKNVSELFAVPFQRNVPFVWAHWAQGSFTERMCESSHNNELSKEYGLNWILRHFVPSSLSQRSERHKWIPFLLLNRWQLFLKMRPGRWIRFVTPIRCRINFPLQAWFSFSFLKPADLTFKCYVCNKVVIYRWWKCWTVVE